MVLPNHTDPQNPPIISLLIHYLEIINRPKERFQIKAVIQWLKKDESSLPDECIILLGEIIKPTTDIARKKWFAGRKYLLNKVVIEGIRDLLMKYDPDQERFNECTPPPTYH